jgi:hypothetical protein
MAKIEGFGLATLLATVGIGLSVASLLIPWFAFQRDEAVLLILRPALGFDADGTVEKRPWWGALPPEGGTCRHPRASRTVVYESHLSDRQIALVRWGGRAASLFTLLDVLAWMVVFAGGMRCRRLYSQAMAAVAVLVALVCAVIALFVPCSVIFAIGNACWGTSAIVHAEVPERIAIQGVSLLPGGLLSLAAGTALEAAALALTVRARRRMKGAGGRKRNAGCTMHDAR